MRSKASLSHGMLAICQVRARGTPNFLRFWRIGRRIMGTDAFGVFTGTGTIGALVGDASQLSKFVFQASVTRNFEKVVEMAEGTIKKLTEKGFGFIDTGGHKDLFFHMQNLDGVRFEELREGQRESYKEGSGPKGPVAENVKPV